MAWMRLIHLLHDGAIASFGAMVQERVSTVARGLADEVGLRFLLRHKTGFAMAVFTMALALAANTAAFSVLKAFLFSSLGVPDPDRLLVVAPVAAHSVTTLKALVWEAHALPRLRMVLLLTFALVAIGITALGSYGTMSQLVMSRERELVVRLVVGAEPRELGRSMLLQNARLSLAGAAVGLAIAWASAGVMRQFVVGLDPRSLPILVAAASATLCLMLLATLPPALRPMHLDVGSVLATGPR